MDATNAAACRLKSANRAQLVLRTIDVEKLLPQSHSARAIWQLVGRLDLSGYLQGIEAVENRAGRPAWDPHLLASLWVYAYSRGISSAREIEQRLGYDPAFQWLAGLEVINYHTLADFRSGHEGELNQLFAQLLGVLSSQKLIRLRQVAHDGTKVKAMASDKSFRREGSLQMHLEKAQQQVRQLSEAGRQEALSARQQQARQRAARQRVQRLEEAQRQLAQLQGAKAETEKAKQRVSLSDPDARIMRTGHDGYIAGYNVQLTTDAEAGLVVGVGVSQQAADVGELQPAMEQVEERLGQKPEQLLVDGGYVSKANIVWSGQEQIDLIGPKTGPGRSKGIEKEKAGFELKDFQYEAADNQYRCLAGEVLRYEGSEERPTQSRQRYRAAAAVCRACRFQSQCCPKSKKGRSLVLIKDHPEVEAFNNKMETEEAKQIYKKRAPLAEFTNAWLKAKMNLRQFRLRGLKKVGIEVVWACLSYNIQQWIRLNRKKAGRLQLAAA
jgi:transposase